MSKSQENYGDLLSKYLVEKISGKSVKWIKPGKQYLYNFPKKNFLCIGSILHHSDKKSVIWGSGIINQKLSVKATDFRAVRGPETRAFLLSKGLDCPEVYGDPALLLPDYYHPEIQKKYELGIIPHYNDYKQVSKLYDMDANIKVIDIMTSDVEEKTKEILECSKIISSSLHGVIVAHAYNIPVLCVKFSDKIFGNGIKYRDYYNSLDLDFMQPYEMPNKRYDFKELIRILNERAVMPDTIRLDHLKKKLLSSCPF